METPEKPQGVDLRKDYEDFDLEHAPLRYPGIRPQVDALAQAHPEFTEAKIFTLEDDVFFNTLESFPLPEGASKGLTKLYKRVDEKDKELKLKRPQFFQLSA